MRLSLELAVTIMGALALGLVQVAVPRSASAGALEDALAISRATTPDVLGDAGPVSRAFAAEGRAENSCKNTCRARYRDCLGLKQLSSTECRGVYRDCTNYTCSRAGPG